MIHEALSQQKGKAQIIHVGNDLATKKQLDVVIAEDIVELTLKSNTTHMTEGFIQRKEPVPYRS